jgi:transcriptional regulator of acetoin/glycerol metabolism/DNA-binding CsgD family transcriptional regulator
VRLAVGPDGAVLGLREVVERFDEAVGQDNPPRDEIMASWERCVLLGLHPEHFVVPYNADLNTDGRLNWAARPVVDRVADDLTGTSMGLLLTDQTGQVLVRKSSGHSVGNHLDQIQLAPGFVYSEEVVGTNAIGTAIKQRGVSVVQRAEHFADALIGTACTAVCVSDPVTGHVLGVVDLTCDARDMTPLMLPLAKRVAWEIEQRLLDDASVDERTLRERFLKARLTTRQPLAVLNNRMMLVNSPATALVQASDRDLIWDTVVGAVTAGRHNSSPIALASGRVVTIRCESVIDGVRLVGAVVHFDTGSASAERLVGVRDQRVGWSTLTRTEQAVAALVAEGMTNAEAAARLVLSPHTIDYHLRQVFRKIDVHSRVEMTRAVVKRQAELQPQ